MSSLFHICTLFIMTLSLVFPGGRPLWQSGGVAQAAAAAASQCFAVSPGKAATLSFEGATLEIGPTAVSAKTDICITPLDQGSMSALDKGMTDVTQGQRKGYRFTPDGMRFSAKIKVRLPYDPTLIPATSSEQDLKSYFFDDQLGMWVELERVAVDTTAKTITSLTDHFTDMINATVVVPDHPENTSLNPTSIKDMKAADPGAAINLIAPPKVNNMGDARLSY